MTKEEKEVIMANCMRMYMKDIAQAEKNLLTKQFLNSPFYKAAAAATTKPSPTTLDIFDFDSTLFLSPLLSPNVWHTSFINAITTENLMGCGWWRDIKTLEVVDTTIPHDWQNYWNENVVKAVQLSCQNPSSLTVLLTGRRHHPFHALMTRILQSKGLSFDILGLRPDPEQPEPTYCNIQPNVFDTTMDFKTAFIIHLLSAVPSLQDVVMWDDRSSHIGAFQWYLKSMVSKNLIKTGKLVCVKPLRPKYNPTWELKTVQRIIVSHNEAIRQQLNSNNKVVEVENYGDEIISSIQSFELKQVPCIPVIKLDEKDILDLKSSFEPYFVNEEEVLLSSDWEKNAEQPLFFGNQVLLIDPSLQQQQQQQEEEEEEEYDYTFKIIARSKPKTRDDGLMVKVQDLKTNKTYILPLWYKPSDFIKLVKREYQWISFEQQQVYKGIFGYHYLYIITPCPGIEK